MQKVNGPENVHIVFAYNNRIRMKYLPVSTGKILFSSIENASRTWSLDTDSAISSLLVNKYEISRLKTMHKTQKIIPIIIEVPRATLIENFAALALPIPNSFDMRTLYEMHIHDIL